MIESELPVVKKIAIVAPARGVTRELAASVSALAADLLGDDCPEIAFHPQCFQSAGHFAGSDDVRADAFLEVANDPSVNAVWFARGGYGSCRLPERVFDSLTPAARTKAYIGYSDLGALMGRLYRKKIGVIVHAPMPADFLRDGGEAAVARTLKWLCRHETGGVEASARPSAPVAAFNITVLSHLIGTKWEPDLSGHVVMLEDIGEYLDRLDRSLFSIMSSRWASNAAGFMLGRISDVPENDIPFGFTEEEMIRRWCDRIGAPFLGRADIGHDIDNKIVVFG